MLATVTMPIAVRWRCAGRAEVGDAKIAIGADPGDDAAVREQPVGAAPSCVPVHACDEQPWRECSARRRPLSRVSNSALSQRPQHLHP